VKVWKKEILFINSHLKILIRRAKVWIKNPNFIKKAKIILIKVIWINNINKNLISFITQIDGYNKFYNSI